jgi:hypothetical protein
VPASRSAGPVSARSARNASTTLLKEKVVGTASALGDNDLRGVFVVRLTW